LRRHSYEHFRPRSKTPDITVPLVPALGHYPLVASIIRGRFRDAKVFLRDRPDIGSSRPPTREFLSFDVPDTTDQECWTMDDGPSSVDQERPTRKSGLPKTRRR